MRCALFRILTRRGSRSKWFNKFILKISGVVVFNVGDFEAGWLFVYLSGNTFIMKRLTVTFCSLLALAFAGCNDAATDSAAKGDSSAIKTDSPAAATETPPAPLDSAAMRKIWMDYATPGEPHKLLASQDGKWDAVVTMWMAPDAPPQTSKGTSVNKMVLGGRYQESRFAGTFDNMPFEGMGTMAYDNAKKVFVSTWMDNMGTGIMVVEGPWDPASKTITLTGKMLDPMTNKECQIREIVTFTDDKHQKMEMYNTQHGMKEYKSLEIVFTRKQ